MRFDQIEHHLRPIKLINMGDSGTGKTGQLASLANAGYRLFILDYDDGLPILRSYLTEEGARRVYAKTLTDKLTAMGQGGIMPVGIPKAYQKGINTLKDWKEEGESLGGPERWGLSDILVLDSMTFFSRAAMRYTQAMGISDMNKPEADKRNRWMHPWPTDYHEAQNRIQAFFDLIHGPEIGCNVIANAHIVKIGGGGIQAVKDKETGQVYMREVDSDIDGKGYPQTVGKKLSPFISRYFNTVVMSNTAGSGSAAHPVIYTVSQPNVALKSELPSALPPIIKVDGGDPKSGLAKLFSLLRGGVEPGAEPNK